MSIFSEMLNKRSGIMDDQIYDVYIVELTYGGHRITFLKYLVKYALDRDLTVCVLTLPETINSGSLDELKITLKSVDINHRFKWLPNGIVSNLITQIEIYLGIKKYLNGIQPRCGVVFPTLQASGAIPLGILGRGFVHPWSGVVMAPAAHLRSYSINSPHNDIELVLQRYAYSKIIRHRSCLRISSFDPLFVEWMHSNKVVECPDPVEILTSYDSVGDEFRQISIGDNVLLVVVGTIDKRKQIPKLAQALNLLPTNSYHLLIAGQVKHPKELEGSHIKALVKDNKATIISRRLSDEEVDYCFFAADVVWSGNSRTYGSSGAVVRGAAHGKPVITMQGSVMSSVLEAVGGGPIADLSSDTDVHKVLQLLRSSQVRKNIGEKNSKAFSDSSVDKYSSTILSPLIDISN